MRHKKKWCPSCDKKRPHRSTDSDTDAERVMFGAVTLGISCLLNSLDDEWRCMKCGYIS